MGSEPSETFHQFIKGQKYYLTTLRKLTSLLKDQAIEKSQAFLSERQEAQQLVESTLSHNEFIFLSMPNQKCYFNVIIAHGVFTRQTFSFVPRGVSKYANANSNQDKQILRKLLMYVLPPKFTIQKQDNQFILHSQYFDLQLIFHNLTLFVGRVKPTEQLEQQFTQYGYELIQEINSLNQLIDNKDMQNNEQLLCYISQSIILLISGYQWQMLRNKQWVRALKMELIQDKGSLDIAKQSSYIQVIIPQSHSQLDKTTIKSRNNYYIQLIPSQNSHQNDSNYIFQFHWDILDHLEDKLQESLSFHQNIQNIYNKLGQFKINAEYYYYLDNQQQGQYQNGPDIIDQIIDHTSAISMFKIEHFAIWLDKHQSMHLSHYPSMIEFKLTLKDIQILESIYHATNDLILYNRIRWIILRETILLMPKTKLKLSINLYDSVSLTQCIQNVHQRYEYLTIQFDEKGMTCRDKFIPIQQIVSDLICINPIEIQQIIKQFIRVHQFAFFQNALQ